MAVESAWSSKVPPVRMAESGTGYLLPGTRAYRFTHITVQDCPGEVTFKRILWRLPTKATALKEFFRLLLLMDFLSPVPSKTVCPWTDRPRISWATISHSISSTLLQSRKALSSIGSATDRTLSVGWKSPESLIL